MSRISKILIANRGEIVLRIQKTLDALNIRSVVVYDDREAQEGYVRNSSQAYSLGSGTLADTYLNAGKIIDIARKAGCEAIHPGYGFLSENAEFAKACAKSGLIFIGPRPEAIDLMGHKSRAIEHAASVGLPVIPRIRVDDLQSEIKVPEDFLPCLVKASAGGGGKGMHLVSNHDELKEVVAKSVREAQNYFGNGDVYLEKYLSDPRHIEVQVLADTKGNTIHLFERECTIQRRFQKIIEETPSPSLTDEQRERICSDAVTLARSVNYLGAGTVEFLLDESGRHYFLEMNTRIQVEHGITELITGVDIVAEQILIAREETLSEKALNASATGHAIEARIYAEDPEQDFKPSPGTISKVSFPETSGIRIDSALEDHYKVFPNYDPMLAKVLAHAKNREEARKKLTKTLDRTVIQGIHHNVGFLVSILENKEFIENRISTHFISDHYPGSFRETPYSENQINLLVAAAAYLTIHNHPVQDKTNSIPPPGYWRWHHRVSIIYNDNLFKIKLIRMKPDRCTMLIGGEIFHLENLSLVNGSLKFQHRDDWFEVVYSWNKQQFSLCLNLDHRGIHAKRADFLIKPDYQHLYDHTDDADAIHAPLNGKILSISQIPNGELSKGETLLIIESMKMENEVRMPRNASLKRICVKEGQMVQEGDLIAELN